MGVRFSSLFIAIVVLFTGAAQAGDLAVSKYVKVYKGDEGIRVAVVLLEPTSGKQALIQVSGVDTAIDGVVLLHEIEDDSVRIAYRTTISGRGYTTLLAEKAYWGGKSFVLRLPEDVREPVTVWYDEKGSKKIKAKDLLATHEQQKKAGTLAKLQDFDRPRHQKDAESELNETVEEVKAACGFAPSVTIDWTSVDDTQIKQLSLSSFCGNPLTAMRHVCESSKELRAALPGRVKAVQCSLGDKMRLRLDDAGTLTWTTNKDAANQVDFAKNYLLNEL